jgi:hypothetical protein
VSAEALADNAFEAHRAGVTEDPVAGMREVFVKLQAGMTRSQQAGKRRLTNFNGLSAQVPAVQL